MSNMVQGSPGDSLGMIDDDAAGDSQAAATGTVSASVGLDGMCECPFCRRTFRISEERGPDDGRGSLKCNRCGYRWTSRGGEPTKCPKCGSYAWKKPVLECRCNVCNYHWVSRKLEGPSRCPNCKSNRWDEVPQMVAREIVTEEAPDVKRKWVLTRYDAGEGCVEIASALGLPLFTVIRMVKESKKTDYLPKL